MWVDGGVAASAYLTFHIDYLPLKFTVSLAAVLRTVLPATQG